jgi:hypothetical protein
MRGNYQMRTEKINFPDEQAFSAFPVERADLAQVASDFGLRRGCPAIVLIGGKVDEEHELITLDAIQMIARVAEDLQAIVISGGTDMGVMAQIGEVRWRSQYKFPLIGIAPEYQVTWPDGPSSTKFLWWGRERWPLAKHYTHFILTPGGDFGDESPWIVDTATLVSKSHGSVTVLINGGEISRRDVELSVDEERPVIALSHTGRLADEIASQPMRDKLISVVPANAVDQIAYVLRAALLMKERSETHSFLGVR